MSKQRRTNERQALLNINENPSGDCQSEEEGVVCDRVPRHLSLLATGGGGSTQNARGGDADLHEGILIKTARNQKDPVPRRIAAISLVVYFVIGSLYFSLQPKQLYPTLEQTAVLDTLLFCVVTLTTVGYGEEVPTTTEGHIFGAFFALTGVAVVGYSFGIIFDEVYQLGEKYDQKDDLVDISQSTDEKLEHKQIARQDLKELLKSILALVVVLGSGTMLLYLDGGVGNNGRINGNATLAESFYFATVTATTIGYGDFFVRTLGGKIALLFYLMISTVLLGHFLMVIVGMPMRRRQRKLEHYIMSQFGRELDQDELISLCQGGAKEGEVSKAEFILRMLVWLGKAEVRDIALCAAKFDAMDKDHNGVLDMKDIRNLTTGNRWTSAFHAINSTQRLSQPFVNRGANATAAKSPLSQVPESIAEE